MEKERPMILKGFIVSDYATLTEAPRTTERYGKHWEIVIGIGSDHCAYLTISDSALKALQRGEHTDIR